MYPRLLSSSVQLVFPHLSECMRLFLPPFFSCLDAADSQVPVSYIWVKCCYSNVIRQLILFFWLFFCCAQTGLGHTGEGKYYKSIIKLGLEEEMV